MRLNFIGKPFYHTNRLTNHSFQFRDELFSLSPAAPGMLSILIWIPDKTLHNRRPSPHLNRPRFLRAVSLPAATTRKNLPARRLPKARPSFASPPSSMV